MALPRWLVQRIVFPAHERMRGRETCRFLELFTVNDGRNREELGRIHDRLLVEHLRRAAEHVPLYRSEVNEREIRCPEDLRRFPVLDKPAIRAAGENLRSDAWTRRLFPLETGGSSGEPLRFWTDQEREASQLACKWRSRAWWGIHPGHRETDLWGSPIEAAKGGTARRIANRLLGFQLLSAFRLDDAAMAGFRAALSGGRADFVYGYASVLARYARWLEERGEDLRGTGLRLAIATAEMLLPADREVIQRVFGCPVADEYGCRDGGLIAHECPRGSKHLMHDAVHVEILDEALNPLPPGAAGEICVTNLHARGFPMIRYRLGDRAALSSEPCPCGLPHPVLASLEGRITDSLVRDDGARVHGLAVIYVLRELPGVARFRCIQERQGHLRILIVPGAGFVNESVPSAVVDRVRRVLGAGTQVDVGTVAELDTLPSGKHQYVICQIR